MSKSTSLWYPWRPPRGSTEGREGGSLSAKPGRLQLKGWGPVQWEVEPYKESGATGMRAIVRGCWSSQVTLTEIRGLHGVVEVLGCPGGHAVGNAKPWGQGAASCPVWTGPRPCLMPQNVHQSPRSGRGMVSDLGTSGRGREREDPGFFPLLTFQVICQLGSPGLLVFGHAPL